VLTKDVNTQVKWRKIYFIVWQSNANYRVQTTKKDKAKTRTLN